MNVNNSILRDKLKALVDLQTILTTHQLAPHELEAVRQKVAELSAPPASAVYSQSAITAPTLYPNHTNPTPLNAPHNKVQIAAPQAPVPPAAPPSIQQPPQLDLSTINSNRLADILASAKAQQAPPTPPVGSTPLPYHQPSIISAPATTSNGEPSSLLAQLRAAGLLAPEGNTPVNGSTARHPQYPPPQPDRTPTTLHANLANPPLVAAQNDVELTSASLKK